MLEIRQTETGWQLVRDGEPVTVDGAATWERYEDVVAVLAVMITAGTLAAVPAVAETDDAPTDGLLPEVWQSADGGGICFSAQTGDGRNFEECDWSWRDPDVSVVPLMLQTSTEFGHFGATLAGFATELWENDGTPGARGRFYNSEAGMQFRDMLLDGRRFGVSVDPGAVTYSEECLAVDDDGWCEQWQINFLTYQIIGITGTPFPGFEAAAIELGPDETEPVTASGAGHGCGCETAVCGCNQRAMLSTRALVGAPMRSVIVASAAPAQTPADVFDVPLAPPRSWFDYPDFMMATPLTITREGRVMGHVAAWNTCHTGHLDRCVTPPRGCDFQDFLQGRVETDDGDTIRTGVLTWRMDHPDHEMTFFEAMSTYGNSDYGWADVTAGEDEHGPWISGALRPLLTLADVRVLRGLALSGDWRVTRRTGRHEFIGCLAVNAPGFPITASASALGVPISRPLVSPSVITAANVIPQSARNDTEDVALLRRIAVLEAREAARSRAVLAGIAAETRTRDLARLRG